MVAAAAACRPVAAALGDPPAHARTHAEELVGALGARFGPLRMDPAVVTARTKFAKGALAPSRMVNDTALWSAMFGDVRTLEIAGAGSAGDYHLRAVPDAPAPRAPGDYRRVNRLRRLGHDEYEWLITDELAIGSVRAADLGRALDVALAEIEREREPAIRAAYRQGMPRTTAALGRLFTLDSIRTTPARDGSTEALVVVSLHTRRLGKEFPRYAKYLDKYVSPAAYRITLRDETGARWWEARARDDRLTLQLRVRDGALAPLDGAPRRMPDVLHADVDFTAKALLFRVGVKRLRADVTLDRGPGGAGFVARFRREPEWVLPPLVERMIRSPLRRPFAGDGARFSYTVRDGGDGRGTITTREYGITVHESAIVRWFGRLGNAALSDFRKGAEREADIFIGQLWSAVRADLLELLPPG